MAIPENRNSIQTNLPADQLNIFLEALETERCIQVPKSASLFEGSGGCQFVFEDATYDYSEIYELAYSINLVSGKPVFIQSLIDTLELELSKTVEKRDYDAAKQVNNKIIDLKRLLISNQNVL